jgi:mannose-1-phosphate guanylyltransferase
MSRRGKPKQLIPFLDGRTLLYMAWERLEGLLPPEQIYVCASEDHRRVILDSLPDLPPDNFIGEPMGMDTLNAVALSSIVVGMRDPDAVLAVVTGDHIIGPRDRFQAYVARGFELVEQDPRVLITFGITPTAPATGFGYLELGERVGEGVYVLRTFKEKPQAPTAEEYFAAGPERYLWNSGMFVWRPEMLLGCVRRYEPETFAGLQRIREAWAGPDRVQVLADTYPTLHKISVDYAVMERASKDPTMRVLALPMSLEWMDVGNWQSFALTCPADPDGNRIAADRAVLEDCKGTLVASTDPSHIIAVVGCTGLMVIHTPDATLICSAELAEAVKDVTKRIGERFGPDAL